MATDSIDYNMIHACFLQHTLLSWWHSMYIYGHPHMKSIANFSLILHKKIKINFNKWDMPVLSVCIYTWDHTTLAPITFRY